MFHEWVLTEVRFLKLFATGLLSILLERARAYVEDNAAV